MLRRAGLAGGGGGSALRPWQTAAHGPCQAEAEACTWRARTETKELNPTSQLHPLASSLARMRSGLASLPSTWRQQVKGNALSC